MHDDHHNQSPGMIRLSAVEVDRKVKLVRIDAGRGLNSRLAAMGLVPGAELTIVNSGRPGPFVVTVKGSKVMLGRGMADKIMVS